MSNEFCWWSPSHFTDLWPDGGKGKIAVTCHIQKQKRKESCLVPLDIGEEKIVRGRFGEGTLHVRVCPLQFVPRMLHQLLLGSEPPVLTLSDLASAPNADITL